MQAPSSLPGLGRAFHSSCPEMALVGRFYIENGDYWTRNDRHSVYRLVSVGFLREYEASSEDRPLERRATSTMVPFSHWAYRALDVETVERRNGIPEIVRVSASREPHWHDPVPPCWDAFEETFGLYVGALLCRLIGVPHEFPSESVRGAIERINRDISLARRSILPRIAGSFDADLLTTLYASPFLEARDLPPGWYARRGIRRSSAGDEFVHVTLYELFDEDPVPEPRLPGRSFYVRSADYLKLVVLHSLVHFELALILEAEKELRYWIWNLRETEHGKDGKLLLERATSNVVWLDRWLSKLALLLAYVRLLR